MHLKNELKYLVLKMMHLKNDRINFDVHIGCQWGFRVKHAYIVDTKMN